MSNTESRNPRRERVEPGIYKKYRGDDGWVYELYVKVNGRPRRRALPEGMSLAQARRALTKLRAERDAGTSPLGTRDDPRLAEASTLAIASLRLRTKLTGKGRISEATVESHEQRLRDHIHPALGRRKLSTLTKRDVLQLIDELRAKGLSEWTCHHCLTALRTVLRHARENDLLARDPFQGIPADRLPTQAARTPGRVLRGGDVNLVLAEIDGVRDLAVATVLADLGLRVSELCGLHWRDVSLTEGTISVEGQLARNSSAIVPTKSAAGVRMIPLTPRALARLERLYMHERGRGLGHDDDFVFTVRTGSALDRHNVRRIIRNAAWDAGIGRVTPQVLRRSVATAYAEATVSGHIAASITGHSPAVYHQHYVKPHLDQQEREQALQRLLDYGYGAG